MHRVDTNGSVAGLFSDGNPATPTAPTLVDAAILNAAVSELVNAVEAAGVVLVKGTNNQLAGQLLFKAVAQTISALHTFSAGIAATQSVVDTVAISATGNGTAAAISGLGGSAGGQGAYLTGRGAGDGVRAVAAGSGHGASFDGGTGGSDTAGLGMKAVATSANGTGARGEGFGAGKGMIGKGGATGAGIHGIGGATSGAGVRGDGGPNSNAVEGVADATASGTGVGGYFVGGDAGYGAVVSSLRTTNPVRAGLRIVPVNATPTVALAGDLCVVAGKLYIATDATPTWVLVGVQVP